MAGAKEFWTSEQVDPKRKYRFKVELASGAATGTALETTGVIWFAKTVDKPEITINTGEVNFMAHKFYYPGTVEWNEVNLVLVDPVRPDGARATTKLLENMGYLGPKNAVVHPSSPSKKHAFRVIISQIDSVGSEIEKWTLNNAILTKLGFGDLDYTSEDLTEISMTFRYDWAELEAGGSKDIFGGSSGPV